MHCMSLFFFFGPWHRGSAFNGVRSTLFVTPTGEREKKKKGLLIRIQGMHALKVK
jgi:hypothetical protein